MTELRIVDPVDNDVWAELSRSHGSLFNSPPWLGAIEDTYGFEPEAWIVERSGSEVVGGLPLIRLGDGPWQRLSALPFSDYSNPIDVDGSAWPVLATHLDQAGLPVELRCLGTPDAVTDERFTSVGPPDLWHGVDLTLPMDEAWDRVAGSARRAIRKARDVGVEARVSTDLNSLRSFFELHLGTRKNKYRLLAQPFDFFVALHKRFGDDIALVGAWHEDTLVAGILLIVWADVVYYKFNASSPAALDLRPNDLLMWESMRFGADRGLTTLDLGRTDGDHESLARYKSKYATTQDVIHTLRRGDFRRDPLIGQILGPVTELLTDPAVPDPTTEEAGNRLYRHFA